MYRTEKERKKDEAAMRKVQEKRRNLKEIIIAVARRQNLNLTFFRLSAPVPGFRLESWIPTGRTCWSHDPDQMEAFLDRYSCHWNLIMASIIMDATRIKIPMGEINERGFRRLVETHNL